MLNLLIYMAIVGAGKLVVTHSLQGQKGRAHLELVRRNYSSGASYSNTKVTRVTPVYEASVICPVETVTTTYHMVTNSNNTRDAATDTSEDVWDVGISNLPHMLKRFIQMESKTFCWSSSTHFKTSKT